MAEAAGEEKTSILKTVRIVSKWMQLVEDAKEMKAQEGIDDKEKIDALHEEVSKESTNEKEMMDFVEAFREEMALHQQQTSKSIGMVR